MARIRTIKPSFFRHEELQDLEAANPGLYCMLVFVGLWTQCDNQGVFSCQPRQLKLDILPFLNFEMERTLSTLEAANFLERYTVGGKSYGIISSFPEHQRFTGKESGEKGRIHPSPEQRDIVPEKQRGINGEPLGKQNGINGEAPGTHQGNNREAIENSKAESSCGTKNNDSQNACLQTVSDGGKHIDHTGEIPENHQGSNGETPKKQSGKNGERPVSQEREKERSKDTSVSFCPESSGDNSGLPDSILKIPLIKKDGFFSVTQKGISEWQDTFPGVNVLAELKKYRQWANDNPARRKTAVGIRKSITYWLSKAQDQGRCTPMADGHTPGDHQDSKESKSAWLRKRTNDDLKALAARGNIAAMDLLRERGAALPP